MVLISGGTARTFTKIFLSHPRDYFICRLDPYKNCWQLIPAILPWVLWRPERQTGRVSAMSTILCHPQPPPKASVTTELSGGAVLAESRGGMVLWPNHLFSTKVKNYMSLVRLEPHVRLTLTPHPSCNQPGTRNHALCVTQKISLQTQC